MATDRIASDPSDPMEERTSHAQQSIHWLERTSYCWVRLMRRATPKEVLFTGKEAVLTSG